MNTRHLALFLQVIKKGNITQAANELNMSQPALSMQLKRLEKELGVTLFTVVGRNISVTDAGITLAEYAEAMLSLEGQINRSMDEFREGKRGRIVIGSSRVVETYLLAEAICSFTEAYPNIGLELKTYTDEEIERLVRLGSIDAGLTLNAPIDHFSLRVTSFANVRLIGIQPPAPLKTRRMLIPGDMAVPEAEELGLDVMRLESTEAVKRFVMEGVGYGVVLESSVESEIAGGKLQQWPGYRPYVTTVNVVTRPAERLSQSLWYFLNHLRTR
ncbi:LysR family transcriptional regulator [Fictibacillus sp. Mic-4]|uniref:LysR family transcriptional regulator n=1 Tax=Fictibacillus TaxID=1329200 RepID=UPI00041F6F84|nr:LysR family transcriptional regulator [Fictibacillus gelatini]